MAAKRRLRFSSVAGPSPKRGRAARGDDEEEEERPPQEPDESEEEAPPASVVEVYLLVEECEERLDEQKVRDFLLLCQRTLGAPSAGQMSGVSDSEQHASGDGDDDGAEAAEGE